jgi:23S rRNA (guanosine2251-2'-O)-methyltransferase
MTRAKTRLQQDIWLTGIHPAREALRSPHSPVMELWFAREDERLRELLQLAESRGIPCSLKNNEMLTSFIGHPHHQGVALHLREFPYTPLEDLLEAPLTARDPLLIVDCVQDPQNLGALMRSACFLGAKAIVIPRDRSANITGTVARVAAGAVSLLPVARVTNLTVAMERLKAAGLWIVGLDAQSSLSIYEADLTLPLGLVVGNEEKGMRTLIRKQCDFLLNIPGSGLLNSLNAATAGAVALAETLRQRLKSGAHP